MNTFNTVVKFFVDCGPFLYPSLLMMSLGVAIAIERFMFLNNRARSENRKLWDQVLPMLQAASSRKWPRSPAIPNRRSARSSATASAHAKRTPPRRHRQRDGRRHDGNRAAPGKAHPLHRHLANTITLVGLLGTIIGLIKGFTAVAAVNPAEKAEMLSASISVAMNNTAFALMVAIPFLLIHAFLQARASEIVDSLEAAKITFLNLVQRLAGDQLTTREHACVMQRAREAGQTPMRRRRLHKSAPHLEITAFINLIVVLVPFLLSTAVFSRLAVLDLNLPAQQSAVEQLKGNDLQLEVVIRRDALEVGDRVGGLIQRIERKGAAHDMAALAAADGAGEGQVPRQDRSHRAGRTRHPLRPHGAGDGRGERQAHGRRQQAAAHRTLPEHLHRRRTAACGRPCGHGSSGHQGSQLMAVVNARERRTQHRARNNTAMDMNLVALIDVFTILIFFLLSSATGVETLVSPKAVNLPVSNAEKAPKQTVLLVVSGDDVLVEGRRVASVAQAMAAPEDVITGLKAELDLLATRSAVRAENKAQMDKDGHAITIMADKEMPYSLLRKLMTTCARASFSDVSFAVRKRINA
jgi:biopolymer transport protein ExbB/TolQ/biopolymer transport protein ExbD